MAMRTTSVVCALILSLATTLSYPNPAQAQTPVRINFPKGKTCANYPVASKGKKAFRLRVNPYDEQLLYLYNNEGVSLESLTVKGTQGRITAQATTGFGIIETDRAYPIRRTGDYSITFTSRQPIKHLFFCVIDNPNGEKP